MQFDYYTAPLLLYYHLFFFNDTATTEIYTLSLHDALPISNSVGDDIELYRDESRASVLTTFHTLRRSEEHTSELQSQSNLVCRLLLEKKKKKKIDCLLENNAKCISA